MSIKQSRRGAIRLSPETYFTELALANTHPHDDSSLERKAQMQSPQPPTQAQLQQQQTPQPDPQSESPSQLQPSPPTTRRDRGRTSIAIGKRDLALDPTQELTVAPDPPNSSETTIASPYPSDTSRGNLSSRRLERNDTEYDNYLMRAKSEDFSDLKPLNFLYQSGKDPFGRPIVVVIGANLPARSVDMERVTLYAISIMDPIVESEYVLVYVHTNITSENKPNFAWLRKMYTIFNRKYKKHLKTLYIIHPTVWFWKKLIYVEQSADIFNYFPKEQLSLPNYVLTYGRPAKKTQPIFGHLLEDVVKRQNDNEGRDVPILVTKAIEYLRARALQIEGIFRISGSNAQIKELKRSFDGGEDVDFNEVEDPHVVAGMLKLYFRELPNPLFVYNLYPAIIQFENIKEKDEQVRHICSVLGGLPRPHRVTARVLFTFLAEVVGNSQVNRMTASNVSIVMAPNLIRDEQESLQSAVDNANAINSFVAALISIAMQFPDVLAAASS